MIEVPKVWGLPTELHIRWGSIPEGSEEAVIVYAEVFGSKLDYVQKYKPISQFVPERIWGDKDFHLVLSYMENIVNALIADLRTDFGTEPLRDSITPREQTQGE